MSLDTRSAKYRAAGPPDWPARILAPCLIAATVVAMTSGIVMWLNNNRDQPWTTIHIDSVVIMGGVVGLHLLIHFPGAVRSVVRDLARLRQRRWSAGIRMSVVTLVLVAGIGVGFVTQPGTPFPVHDRGDGT